MKFNYTMETNLKIGQALFGIIAVSTRTYDGVHPIIVHEIDFNNEEIIFEVDQPCRYVVCDFYDVDRYVFETEEEASEAKYDLRFGDGLVFYDYY